MKLAPLACLLIILSETVQAQSPEKPKYLGQVPPGLTSALFAPGLVSLKDQSEFGSIFSRDGKEFYFAVDRNGKAEMLVMNLENQVWTKPEKLLVHEKYSFNDPSFSPDENRLYFISDMPLEGTGEKKDFDIWYIERKGKQWSKPVNAGNKINSAGNEYYVSFTKTGTMYFSSNGRAADNKSDYDIYAAKNEKGKFQERVKLSSPVNTPNYEADVFVAGDESYLIFCSDRPGGFGGGDLYICFKKSDGTWTDAKNMGKEINADRFQYCPYVSSDGKYFFYTSKDDIHWIDAGIIDGLR